RIVASHEILVAEPSNRGEEPQRVALDGPADCDVALVGAIRRVDKLETARLQFGSEIVAGETLARIVRAEQRRELVPAVFRDEVRLRAAVLEFGGLAAELDAGLGSRGRVKINPAAVPSPLNCIPSSSARLSV